MRYDSESLQNFFELSYAQYLTVPRSILEAMPAEWQDKFGDLLHELDATFDWRPDNGRYWCNLRDAKGRFVSDPLHQYRHPDKDLLDSLRKSTSDHLSGSTPGEVDNG